MVLEPAAQAFVELTARGPHLHELPPARARALADKIQTVAARADVSVEETVVPGGPPARILRPRAAARPPVILYLHGGGWTIGSARSHDRLVRELAAGTGAAVVFPSYSLSPEARYPVALDECRRALAWIVTQGAEHGLDGARVAVAGDSAGGNLAAALALGAKGTLAAQALFYPVTDAGMDTASYARFAEGAYLRRDTMAWFWDQYLPDRAARGASSASPLRATDAELAGLPPALVVTAEADVLRDEGEAYAARLRGAGVPVVATRYPGAIHDFMMLDALRETEAARAALAQAVAFLAGALR